MEKEGKEEQSVFQEQPWFCGLDDRGGEGGVGGSTGSSGRGRAGDGTKGRSGGTTGVVVVVVVVVVRCRTPDRPNNVIVGCDGGDGRCDTIEVWLLWLLLLGRR